jgi:hypothetical protein
MSGRPRLTTPLMPTTRCILDIDNVSHQGHYRKVIRHTVAVPPLHQYLSKKFGWSANIVSDIDWDTFKLAANNYQATDNHLLKLVYDLLPTRKQKSYASAWVPATCRYCDQPETFEHLLKCDNPHSPSFRTKLSNAVLHHCNRFHSPRSFTTAILQAIRDWLDAKPVLRTIITPNSMHSAIAAQDKIGWFPLIKGYLSQAWTKYLQYTVDNSGPTSPTRKLDIPAFLSGLVKIMWQSQSDFWHAHLDNIHHRGQKESSPDKLQELQTRIRMLHQRQDEVLASHRSHYFKSDVEEFIATSNTRQLQAYLLHYGPAIQDSIKRARKADTSSSVLTFTGFTRRLPTRTTFPHRPTTNVSSEVPSHRNNHSRWRPGATAQDRFRNFFSSPNPSP